MRMRNAGEVWMERQEQMRGFADGKRRRRFSSAEGRRYSKQQAGRKRKNDNAEILLEKRLRSGFLDTVRVCILKQDVEEFSRRWVNSAQHGHDDPSWWDGDDGSTGRQHSSEFIMDEIQLEKSYGFLDNLRVCILKQDVGRDEELGWVPSVKPDDTSATFWLDGNDGSARSSGRHHFSNFSMDEISLEQRPPFGFFDNELDTDGDGRFWVPSVQQHDHDDPSASCWWDGDDGSTKSSGRQHSSDFSMDEISLEQKPLSGFFDNELDTGGDARFWVPLVQQHDHDDPSAIWWWDGDDASTKSSGRQHSSDFSMDEVSLEQKPLSGFFDNELDTGRDERFARRWVPSVQQHDHDDPSASCWRHGDNGSTKSFGRQHSSDFSMDEISLEQKPPSGFFENELDTGRDERFASRWVPSVQQHDQDDPSASCWWDGDDGSTKSSGRQHSSDFSMDEMRLAISKSMEDMERTQEKMRETHHEVRIAKRKVDRLWEEIEADTPLRRAHYQALVEAERAQAKVS